MLDLVKERLDTDGKISCAAVASADIGKQKSDKNKRVEIDRVADVRKSDVAVLWNYMECTYHSNFVKGE